MVALLLAIVAGYQAGPRRWPGGVPPIHKLGIETMQNRTGDRSFDFACDLVTDDVALELEENLKLAVVFVRESDADNSSERELLRRLELDAILAMSLERCGDHFCATVQLHHAESPHPVWSYTQRFSPDEDAARMHILVAEAGKAVGAWAE